MTQQLQRQRQRQLGASDAVVLGLGALLGAGVFAGFAPVAAVAGKWLLPALAIAALAAMCSAFSTSDQSADNPEPGGGYVYTREQLGCWPARMAGSAFLAAKAAAAAVAAGIFGSYVVPGQSKIAALAAIAVVVLLNASGLRLGVRVSWILTGIVVGVLVVVVAVCFAIAPPDQYVASVPRGQPGSDDPRGLTAAAALLFFAFAGFERVTAPGDGEPRHSARQLRRAIPIMLVLVTGLYLLVGMALLRQLGPVRLSRSPAPMLDALAAADASALIPIITLGATIATLGSLVFVLSAFRRTLLAMIRNRELPMGLGTFGPTGTAWRADVVAGLVAMGMVLLLDPVQAMALSACCLLAYYAFTNAAARLLLAEERTWPMRTACFGLGISVMLGMSLPPMYLLSTALIMGGGALLAGLISGRWKD